MLFDHVDVRVRSVAQTRRLFDALLPAMGYTQINADEESAGYHRPDETGASDFVWFVEERGHVPNGTRLAFAAPTRAEVDHLAQIARANGARRFEPAQLCSEYGPHYYASFFEDDEGNRYEICCRRPAV